MSVDLLIAYLLGVLVGLVIAWLHNRFVRPDFRLGQRIRIEGTNCEVTAYSMGRDGDGLSGDLTWRQER